MRTFSRRAAIGATTLALLLAATGTSFAAVRSSRSVGGPLPGGLALPMPRQDDGVDPTLPPTVDIPESGASESGESGLPRLEPPDPQPAPVAPEGSTDAADPAPTSVPSTPPPARPTRPTGPEPPVSRIVRVPPPVPIGGPTPTLAPISPTPTTGCPSGTGLGALPRSPGVLQAVNLTLPWPGTGPLVLLPQASVPHASGVAVTISESSAGARANDGSTLTLDSPVTIAYTVTAGQEVASGTIRFTSAGPPLDVTRQACRDRSLVLHDVARAALDGSPLRIVGVVAPPGTVTVDGNGGIARFRSAVPGRHVISLVTATDAGFAGPLISVTVTVV